MRRRHSENWVMAWPVSYKILLNDRKVILPCFSVLFCLTIAPRQNWSSDVTLNMQVLLKKCSNTICMWLFCEYSGYKHDKWSKGTSNLKFPRNFTTYEHPINFLKPLTHDFLTIVVRISDLILIVKSVRRFYEPI